MLDLTSRRKRPGNSEQHNLLPLEFLPNQPPSSNAPHSLLTGGATFAVSKSSGMPHAVTSAVSGVYRMYLNFVAGNLSPTFKGAIVLQLMDGDGLRGEMGVER